MAAPDATNTEDPSFYGSTDCSNRSKHDTVQRDNPDDDCSATSETTTASTRTASSHTNMKKPKVTFYPRVNFRRVYVASPIEHADRWYSRKEIRSFRLHDKNLQTLVEGNNDYAVEPADETLPMFGLKTGKDRKLRIRLIKESKSTVLREQACQEEHFLSCLDDASLDSSFHLDHALIAEFYAIYAKKAAFLAHLLGMQAAWHVEDLWRAEGEEETMSKTCTYKHIPEKLALPFALSNAEENRRLHKTPST